MRVNRENEGGPGDRLCYDRALLRAPTGCVTMLWYCRMRGEGISERDGELLFARQDVFAGKRQ
jgi:hypothetical protein